MGETLTSETFFQAAEADIKIVRHFDQRLDVAIEHVHSILEAAEPSIHVALKRSETGIELSHDVIQLKDTDHHRAEDGERWYADRQVELNIVQGRLRNTSLE
jgi:hypothetical protein